MNDETEASYAVHERLRNAWLAGCRAGLDAAAKQLNDENCPNCAAVIRALDPETIMLQQGEGAAPAPDTAQDSDGASESPHESPTIDAEAPALDQTCTEAAPEPAPMSQRGE